MEHSNRTGRLTYDLDVIFNYFSVALESMQEMARKKPDNVKLKYPTQLSENYIDHFSAATND